MQFPIQFGPYILVDRVSVGGMAEIFKAKEYGVEGFERTVAVKRILPHVAEDDEFIAMFKDEAMIAVQLNHGSIAQIYSLGNERDSFYIALEFVHGRDLRAIFQKCQQQGHPMPIAQACYVIMKVCEGLDYAHNKKDKFQRDLKIVHRDVSPPNVLVSFEGEVKLIDFGVAKAAGRASRTQAGILKGKFGYMSPEQVRGISLDRRSDVFSVGVVFFEILTGRRLFQADTDFATLERVRAVDVPSPRSLNPEISAALEAIIFKTLTREPDERYSSAIELHDDLQAFMFSQGLFYSRKDLAAWMRERYAAEIDAEKERDKANPPVRPGADGVNGPSLHALQPGVGGRAKPPVEGPALAVPTADQRRKSHRPKSGNHRASPGGVPKSARQSATGRSAEPIEFDWDDDELETRLFESDGQSKGYGAGPPAAPRPPASPERVGMGASMTGSDRPGTMIPSVDMPARVHPPHNRDVGSPGAAYPVAAMPPVPPVGYAPAPANVDVDPLRRSIVGPIVGVVAALLVVSAVAGLAFFLFRDAFSASEVKGAPPKGASEATMALARDARAALTVAVTPADALVRVDGDPIAGTSPFEIRGLKLGPHRLDIAREGFFPVERDIEVPAVGLVLPVQLEAREVMLWLRTEPSDVALTLLVDGKPVPMGDGEGEYTVVRSMNARYQVEASKGGFVTKRIGLEFTGEPRQDVVIGLVKDPVASPEEAQPAVVVKQRSKTSRSRRSKKKKSKKSAKKSSTLKIGTNPGVPPAKVYVDNRFVGKTPIGDHNVTPGRHRIRFKWSEIDKESVQTVSVADGAVKIVKAGRP